MNTFHLSRKWYIVACICVISLAGLVLWFTFIDISLQIRNETKQTLQLRASLKKSLVENTFNQSVKDIGFLHDIPTVAELANFSQNDGSLSLKEGLVNIFYAYIKNNNNIAQIRLIGVADNGREIVRVHRKDGQINIIRGQNLQQKANRAYFKEAIRLKKGQLYVSEITLNREFGKIEQPQWPTYRVAQPVYDNEGQVFGIVIINFNAQILLDKFVEHIAEDEDIVLLNSRGQYIVDSRSNKAFTFEYGDDRSWYTDELYSKLSPDKENLYYVALKSISGQQTAFMPSLTIVVTQDPEVAYNTTLQRYIRVVMIVVGLTLLALLLLTLYRLFCDASFLRQKAQAQMEAIVKNSEDLILSMDTKGKIESWNATALAFFGLSENQMKTAFIEQLIQDKQELTKLKQQRDAVFTSDKARHLEISLRGENGQNTVLSVILSPVKMSGYLISSVSAIFRDVTQDSLLKESLQISNKQLAVKNQEMEAFIYTVSHDLKSPLVTIGGFSDRILKTVGDSLDEKNRHRLVRIKDNVDDMAKLLSSLLNLSRVVKQELDLAPVKLITCIQKAQEHLSKLIDDSGAVFEIQGGQQELVLNSMLFTQCLENLFSNAINYASVEKPLIIKIEVKNEDNFFCINVTDNGIGIAKEHQEKVFKIFERLEVGTGTGVGLAIVKTVMEKHQGHVRLSSTVGVGSTFSLYIPKQHS